MNWTGGRLQRHSKANANAQVKAQKDYFARARIRQNTKASAPSPLHLSIAAPPEQQARPRHSLDLPGHRAAVDECQSRQGRRRSKFEDATYKSHAITPRSTIHQRAKAQSSHSTTPPRVNTLEHVKRSLLKQPDWLGLAGTRPPNPECQPAKVLDQVGRRRRVTREDRQRQKHGGGQRKIEHHLIKPFAGVDDASVPWPSPSAKLSIRIGSNIHQSQPIRPEHRSENLASAVPDSSSTEPMLLDMVEAQHHPARAKSGEFYLAELNDAGGSATKLMTRQDISDERGLIPLEDVRNFPSFDEVKRYSSSARHTISSSLSVSKQLLSEVSGPRTRPVHHTLSSFVHGRPVDDQGLSSSDRNNNNRLVSIGSEPPVFAKRREDTPMQDIGADAAIGDTSGASREAREFRFGDTSSVATRESLPVFENPNNGVSSLASAAVDARSKYDSPYAQLGKIFSRGQPRAVYTIEEQVQLEELRKQQSNRPVFPDNSRSTMSMEASARNRRPTRRQERESANERRGPQTRYFTPEAKEEYGQNEHTQSSQVQVSSDGNRYRSQGDKNEAWMRDVFCTDFEKLQQRFSYAKAHPRSATHQTPPRNVIFRKQTTEIFDHPELSEWPRNSPQYSSGSSLPKTIKTGANTVLNVQSDMEHDRQRNSFMPSETDFLEQMSPMTGYLDERVANLSTYNNAAHTVRDFVDQKHMAAKRTACDAFGDSSYDQYITSSQSENKVAQTSSPAPHRVPLHTLYQAPVRSHPIHEVQAIHEDLKHVFRPVWRLTEAPTMVSNNRNDRELSSRTENQHPRFPLDYTPVRMSAAERRNHTQGEILRQAPHTNHPQFDSQLFSPTQSSGHRVPLTSGPLTQNADISHYSTQNLTYHSTNRHLTPSAHRGTSTSSRSPGLAPTSSNSAIPIQNIAGPVGNFHTNQAQHFAFRRPGLRSMHTLPEQYRNSGLRRRFHSCCIE
jgi:hypothetical protein